MFYFIQFISCFMYFYLKYVFIEITIYPRLNLKKNENSTCYMIVELYFES